MTGGGGGAHIFFPLCESVQLISLWARCESAWNRSTAEGGELKCEHKRSPFCVTLWISVHSVHRIKFSQLEVVQHAGQQSVYRVCIVHEIVGVGGLFEWGGLARELRTLMEGLELAPATHVGGLWKQDMRRHCVQNTSTSCNLLLLHSAPANILTWLEIKFPLFSSTQKS